MIFAVSFIACTRKPDEFETRMKALDRKQDSINAAFAPIKAKLIHERDSMRRLRKYE